jgi:hypothetical protein
MPDARTYRCEENKSLFEITESFNLLVPDSFRNTLDKLVELLERLFAKNGLYDVLVDLLCSVFTETTLFVGDG